VNLTEQPGQHGRGQGPQLELLLVLACWVVSRLRVVGRAPLSKIRDRSTEGNGPRTSPPYCRLRFLISCPVRAPADPPESMYALHGRTPYTVKPYVTRHSRVQTEHMAREGLYYVLVHAAGVCSSHS
jgi:hypothetical protein